MGGLTLTKRIKKAKPRKGKRTGGKSQPSKIPDSKAGEMFVFWAENGRNLSLTGREFGVKPTACNRLKKADKWDHRYETKILPKLRAIVEGKAIDGLTTSLEIIRELRNKVTERLFATFKDGAKEKIPIPTLDQLCRILITEEYILRGPAPPASVTFNEFGPNMTLVQINNELSPQKIKERYIELADRLRETADIEERRARLDPDGNSGSQI